MLLNMNAREFQMKRMKKQKAIFVGIKKFITENALLRSHTLSWYSRLDSTQWSLDWRNASAAAAAA